MAFVVRHMTLSHPLASGPISTGTIGTRSLDRHSFDTKEKDGHNQEHRRGGDRGKSSHIDVHTRRPYAMGTQGLTDNVVGFGRAR